MSGDNYNRRFDGDLAQCGCEWTRHEEYGDVLVECPVHKAATKASVEKFERERKR